jgi:hypothetical protein
VDDGARVGDPAVGTSRVPPLEPLCTVVVDVGPTRFTRSINV